MTDNSTGRLDDVLAKLYNASAAMEAHRAQRRARVWESLPDEAQALLREAAVMGFVQGHRHGRRELDDRYTDNVIIGLVLDGCKEFNDDYPYLGGLMTETDTATEVPDA